MDNIDSIQKQQTKTGGYNTVYIIITKKKRKKDEKTATDLLYCNTKNEKRLPSIYVSYVVS